tara:strand:+ start:452 stop:1171 length:720 start_codon:yes stop_codon:yes gene_type:complete
MAYQKLQPTQALDVILSDTINPINPSRPATFSGTNDKAVASSLCDLSVATLAHTGNPTSTAASELIDSAADFSNVSVGDTVVNDTTNARGRVVSVDSDTELTLNTNLFSNLTDTYEVYTGGFLGQVSIGDIVVDTTDNAYATVTAVYSAQLTVTPSIFSLNDTYEVYGNTSQMNSDTVPFVVYVGDATGAAATWHEVKVTTAAGNDVVFGHFPTGTFLPVQCLRVWDTGTSATDVVALW